MGKRVKFKEFLPLFNEEGIQEMLNKGVEIKSISEVVKIPPKRLSEMIILFKLKKPFTKKTERKTTKEFIEDSIKIHGDTYDYSKVEYIQNKVKVIIICKIHGDFLQKPNGHLLGHGCKLCGDIVGIHNRQVYYSSQKQDFSHVVPPEGAKIIPLTQGKYAIVDEEDYERVSQYNWCLARRSHTDYASANIDGKGTLLHRFIMEANDTNLFIDHIYHNGLDNRKSQLRYCNKSQNAQNSKVSPNKSSKYKGVCWAKDKNKWLVSITSESRTKFIGYFNDEDEAGRVYDEKAKELFKEFAYLNFPIL